MGVHMQRPVPYRGGCENWPARTRPVSFSFFLRERVGSSATRGRRGARSVDKQGSDGCRRDRCGCSVPPPRWADRYVSLCLDRTPNATFVFRSTAVAPSLERDGGLHCCVHHFHSYTESSLCLVAPRATPLPPLFSHRRTKQRKKKLPLSSYAFISIDFDTAPKRDTKKHRN